MCARPAPPHPPAVVAVFAVFRARRRPPAQVSDVQAHDTCAFWLWHRAFVVAYEDMLRSLLPRFANVTLPWWNIHRDYAKQEGDVDPCDSYATCSRIVNDLGGLAESNDWAEGTFFGRRGLGVSYVKAPVQNLRDDDGLVGLIRYDLDFDPIPAEAASLSAAGIRRLLGRETRTDFWETVQRGVHDAVHDTVGGFMRTTASPIDPIFMPWHSTMELLDYLWSACRGDDEAADAIEAYEGGPRCAYTDAARERFPNLSLADDEAWIRLDGRTDVRDDALIGAYFDRSLRFADLRTAGAGGPRGDRVRYADVPPAVAEALGNDAAICPNGLGSGGRVAEEEDAGAPRRPAPTFSDAQLQGAMRDWMEQARERGRAGGDPVAADRRMRFLTCLLEEVDRDTVERWAIDEGTFLTQVVENGRYDDHPLCRGHLSGPSRSQAAAGDPIPKNATVANGGPVQTLGGGLAMLYLTIFLRFVLQR